MSWEWDKSVFNYYAKNKYNYKKLIKLTDPENDCTGGVNTNPEKFLRLKDNGNIVKVPMMSVATLNEKSTDHWARPYMNSGMIVDVGGKKYRPMSNMAGLSTRIEVYHRRTIEAYGKNPTFHLYLNGMRVSSSVKLPVDLYVRYYIEIRADGKTYSDSGYHTLKAGTLNRTGTVPLSCSSHPNYRNLTFYWRVSCYTDTYQGKRFEKFIDSGTSEFADGYLDFDLD